MGAELNTIILGVTALVTAVTPIMLALINRRQTKATEDAKVERALATGKVEQVRRDLLAQSEVTTRQLDMIHEGVNSERAALMQKVEALNAELRSLQALLQEKR